MSLYTFINMRMHFKQKIDFKTLANCFNISVNIFMTARGKERLVLRNFTYYKQSRTKSGFRWGCTKNRWHKCKAFLHLSDDMSIVRSNLVHTHNPFGLPLRKNLS